MEITIKKLKERQEQHHRTLYGDKETGELGLLDMTKEMYEILKSFNNVTGFFGGVGTFFKWMLLISAGIIAIKTWGTSLLTYFLK